MSTTISNTTENDALHASERKSTSYAHDKAKILARLRRMEGQVRGVQRMVKEDQYCLDVLTQLSAIISAARQTGLLVLDDHIRGCVLEPCRHGHNDQEELLAELSGAIERFTRSAQTGSQLERRPDIRATSTCQSLFSDPWLQIDQRARLTGSCHKYPVTASSLTGARA